MKARGVMLGVVVALVIGGVGLWVAGVPQKLLLGDAAVPVPRVDVKVPAAGAFPHGLLDAALKRHVNSEGRVDYAGVRADEDLQRYVATLASVSPASHPQLFPSEAHELAYYCNAYNALVLYAVGLHWPLKSVQDVRVASVVELKPTQGFFYGQRFVLGGQRVNLYDLENSVIRSYGDARIHAAINCASESCPALEAEAFTAARLDAQLDAVMKAMVADPRHLRIDAATRTLHASAIFDWYKDDFVADQGSLHAYWVAFASPDQAAALQAAAGYKIAFNPYDWGVNALIAPP